MKIKDYYIFNYCLFILKTLDISENLKSFKKIYKLVQSMYVSAFYFFNTLQCMFLKMKYNIKIFYKERFKFIIFLNKIFLLLKYIDIFTIYESRLFLEFLEFSLDFLEFSDKNKNLRIFSLLKLSDCLKNKSEWVFFDRFIFNTKILIDLKKI